jgi:1-aminocyclopropane-1-carboxylate deaminase/D-cysteine desulfhydrase-like pyridoxal-dependent ACC family enzyme
VLHEHDAPLAEQQASLRRITSLVTSGAASADIVAAIAREVAAMLGMTMVQIWRSEPAGTFTVHGAWSEPWRLIAHGGGRACVARVGVGV